MLIKEVEIKSRVTHQCLKAEVADSLRSASLLTSDSFSSYLQADSLQIMSLHRSEEMDQFVFITMELGSILGQLFNFFFSMGKEVAII